MSIFRHRWLIVVPVSLYILVVAFRVAVSTALAHDEQQFIASGLMVAQYGIHPYSGFPYFHVPTLVYLYAGLFSITDHALLAARLFTAACGAAVSMLVLWSPLRRHSGEASRTELVVAACAAVVFTNSWQWAEGSGRSWNHTPSTLCAVLAALVLWRIDGRSLSWRPLFLSGFLLGCAMSIRLTFAPLVVPFLVAMLLPPFKSCERRLAGLVAFAAGGVVACGPTLYFLLVHTDRFLFGTLWYEALTNVYRQQLGDTRAMTLIGKLAYLFGDEVLLAPENLPVSVLVLVAALMVRPRSLLEAVKTRADLGLLVLALPFVLVGVLAPTPSFRQYFFALTAFLVLLVPHLAPASRFRSQGVVYAFAAVLLAAISFHVGGMPRRPGTVAALRAPFAWAPVVVHDRAMVIAERLRGVAPGKVLTIGPLYALEAGFPVYPALVTGRFAWRTAHLISDDDRARQGVVGPADLQALVQSEPPIAVLTGVADDEDLEVPLVAMAQQLGFVPFNLGGDGVLWTPPTSDPRE